MLVNAQNLVLPLYGKAEFEKIASLDDEMPELHVYLTDKPSSQAVVVCPGGGYKGLHVPEGTLRHFIIKGSNLLKFSLTI